MVIFAGCAQKHVPTVLVEGNPPRVYERRENGARVVEYRRWYDANELDEIVREYARDKKLDFDFRGTDAQFWIHRDRQYMADANYGSGMGKPVLSAKIGWDGHVFEHQILIAVCGVGIQQNDSSPPASSAGR